MTHRLPTGEGVPQDVLPGFEYEDRPLNTPVNVFIVSRLGHTAARRVLWRTTKEDAMKICSDERTSSEHHMLVWTADEIDDPKLNTFVEDNGMYNDVLAEHEVRVLDSARYQEMR